jgi:hypothetical protein
MPTASISTITTGLMISVDTAFADSAPAAEHTNAIGTEINARRRGIAVTRE